MSNYEFRIDEWSQKLPVEPEKLGHFRAAVITSPIHLLNNEYLRAQLDEEVDWGEPVGADIFVMARGEPAERMNTKIGGLPYRSAGKQWPVDSDGNAMTFLGQFWFADSKDLTGELPAELLLVFCASDGQFEEFCCEWQAPGITDLIQIDQLPEQGFPFIPCYGYRFRTQNYPDAARNSDDGESLEIADHEVWDEDLLFQYQATQIGEAAFILQNEPDLPGRLLCTLSSVQSHMHAPYPWINEAQPRCAEDVRDFDDGGLMLGDFGCLYIFIDDKQQVSCEMQCH